MHFLKLAKQLPHFFTVQDVAQVLMIQTESARVLCTRYAKKGIFQRLQRNLYMFKEVFHRLEREDLFELSHRMQENSYLSFATALSHYGVLPGHAELIEAANQKRSTENTVGPVTWIYHKLPKELFFGYHKHKNFCIATAEKALLDTLYLYSLGRYYVDLKKINLEAIHFEKLFHASEKFPPRTQALLSNLYARSQKRKGRA